MEVLVTITDDPLRHLFEEDITDKLLDLNMKIWDKAVDYIEKNEGITQLTIKAMTFEAYKEEFGTINATLIDLINLCVQQVVNGLVKWEQENQEKLAEDTVELDKQEELGEQKNV